jgi:hypothetical protein
MTSSHKNKTIATLLAFLFGGLGIHRFYLYGSKDTWAWLHLSSLPFSLIALFVVHDTPLMFIAGPLLISVLASFIETLVIGLTPDDKWDADHNPNSGRQSDSGWPLVLLLVITTGVGASVLIAAIAHTFDLLYTNSYYG